MDRKKKPESTHKKSKISSPEKKKVTGTSGKIKKIVKVAARQNNGILPLFEKIFEWMPYAIAVTDSKGNFIKTNKLFLDLFRTQKPRKEYGIFDDPVLRKAGYGKLMDSARKGKYSEIPGPETVRDSSAARDLKKPLSQTGFRSELSIWRILKFLSKSM